VAARDSDNYHRVMLGIENGSGAASKRVKTWQTLIDLPPENSDEYVS
jgi:hypothetical protein